MKKIAALAILGAVLAAAPAAASVVSIQFSGLNLYYDGFNTATDDGQVANASAMGGYYDELVTMSFFLDNNLLGTAQNNIYADFQMEGMGQFIYDPLNPSQGKTFTPTTPRGIDLYLNGSILSLNWDSDIEVDFLLNPPGSASELSFRGGATTSSILGQALPYGLVLGAPVNVSFSTQGSIAPSDGNRLQNLTESRYIGPFHTFGTGEVVADTVIPEPVTLLTVGLGLVGGGLVSRRRKRA